MVSGESLQFRFGTGIPEQEVMGHSSDPGSGGLEVTAAAAELTTSGWQPASGGGGCIPDSSSVCCAGVGDQVLWE